MGTIVSWLREVGDRVNWGEPIAEVETETNVALEALASEMLVHLTRSAGSEVTAGKTIGFLETEG
ncbi:MAG: biotin/lipoyl-containing protein [Gaiellaceae bacterium]